MGLADDLLEDAQHLAGKGRTEQRASCMRRAVSNAYYSVFYLFVEDFVQDWPHLEQRARLARMFDHRKMRDAQFAPANKNKLTPTETALSGIKNAFAQLQTDRHRADYDLAWNILPTDAEEAILRAQNIFTTWRSIRTEELARSYLLSMFGATR